MLTSFFLEGILPDRWAVDGLAERRRARRDSMAERRQMRFIREAEALVPETELGAIEPVVDVVFFVRPEEEGV